jgi:hypothetical protein
LLCWMSRPWRACNGRADPKRNAPGGSIDVRPLLAGPAAPEQPFEVENLCRGAQSDPHQSLRRQQRDMVAGSAIDLHEVAEPKVLESFLARLSRYRP